MYVTHVVCLTLMFTLEHVLHCLLFFIFVVIFVCIYFFCGVWQKLMKLKKLM
jgi:hypothetical protein